MPIGKENGGLPSARTNETATPWVSGSPRLPQGLQIRKVAKVRCWWKNHALASIFPARRERQVEAR